MVVVPSYKPAYVYGGPVRSIAALCESLSIAGHEVTVYTTTANGDKELDVLSGKTYKIDNVNVIYFSRLTKGHSNLSAGLLKAVVKNCTRYDIVHIQSWWNLVTMPSTGICLLKGIKPIVSPRGTLSRYTFTHRRNWPKRILHYLVGRRWLKHSILHVTSQKESEESIHYVDTKNIYIIPNVLDLPDEISGSYHETPFLNLVFLGRIDPAKNLELLLNVLTHDFSVPYQLTIAGEGDALYTEKLKTISEGHNEIKWVGPLDGINKFKLLAEADILVLPSHTENYGNVVFESLSQGTPVLISAHVGAKEYVLKYSLGWVADGDERVWTQTLQQIWKDKAMREDIRRRAPGCILRDFNKREQVKAYIDMYTHYLHTQKG